MGPDPIQFAHLKAGTESPYTKGNLRVGATYISLSPSGPTAFAGGGHPPPPGGAPLSVSDGGDSTKADGRLDRLITLMELNLQQQQATAGALPATHSQRPARDSGTFGSGTLGTAAAEAEVARWANRRPEVPGTVKLPHADAASQDLDEERVPNTKFDVLTDAVAVLTHVVTKQQQQQQNTTNMPSKLFKLEGAQGQVALDELAELFAEQPTIAVD